MRTLNNYITIILYTFAVITLGSSICSTQDRVINRVIIFDLLQSGQSATTKFSASFDSSDLSRLEIISPRKDTDNNLLKVRGGKSSYPSLVSKVIDFFRSVFGLKKKQKIQVKKGTKRSTSKPVSNSNSAAGSSNSRLQKEIKSFLESPPSNCKLTVNKQNIRSWQVTITGAEGTVYAGEEYKLQMTFPKDYPAKPPSVYFLKPVPRHMHVYSNGDICLNLLGRDWRPIMTAESLAVSILSMLSSAKEKSTPQDNAMHADNAPGKQQDNWMYHDDKC